MRLGKSSKPMIRRSQSDEGGSSPKRLKPEYTDPKSRLFPEHHVQFRALWKMYKDARAELSRPRREHENPAEFRKRRRNLTEVIRNHNGVFSTGNGLEWLQERAKLLSEHATTAAERRRVTEINAFLKSVHEKSPKKK
jgi:hypothetical protein